ncbi:hypothetical protein ACEWY4_003753 [Coilia grayii]|uniref:Hexosyltransferase n=1 Tax=Coilia grayii TaxID=363190 RepID=A0ABD1KS51_9TELE
MVGRGLWGCKNRFGKRSGRFGVVPAVCVGVVGASLLAVLFIDSIELWATSLGMTSSVKGPAQDRLLPQSMPPTRPEEYLLMPSPLVCQRARPYLITMVTTAPPNQRARQAIRDTWGGEVEVRGRRVLTLFMVGVPANPTMGKLLLVEAQEHGDLVQGRFQDTYGNLTLKTLAMLGWVRRFCSQARFVAKVDDDVLFNPSALLRHLDHREPPLQTADGQLADLYLGRVHLHVMPDRNPSSKHFMPTQAYPGTVFPDYCSGTAYVLSRPALLKLSLAATATPLPHPLPPEDVFVGLRAHAAGITPTHCPLFSGGPAVPYSRCCYQAMVSVHHVVPSEMVRFWADAHTSAPCSWLGTRASLGVCKVRALLGTLIGH